MTFDATDLANLALCAWKEARGEGQAGMLAVMLVCRNRVGTPGFSRTLHGVIYSKNQFTSMSAPSDTEYNLAPAPGDPQFLYCTEMAPNVLSGSVTDITLGAHYYYNPATATSPWFEVHIVDDVANHPFLVQIGKQRFYR